MFGLKISVKQVLYKDHINKHKGFHEDIKKKKIQEGSKMKT
jgi:hypothetical protein